MSMQPPSSAVPARFTALWQECRPSVVLGVRMLKMDRDAISEVASQPTGMKVPIILFAVSTVAFGIGTLPHWRMMLVRPLFLLAILGVVHAIARAQGGTAQFPTMLRVGAHLSILEVTGIIPGVGPWLFLLGTAWYLWLLVAVLEDVHGLETRPALRSVAISTVAVLGLLISLAVVEGAIRGASSEDSLAPGALSPGRATMKELNEP